MGFEMRLPRTVKGRIAFILLVLGAVLAVYVFLIEPNILEIVWIQQSRDYTIRIVFFADLHMWRYRSFHDRVLQRIEDLQPDLILFGGDALGMYTVMEDMELFFEKLVKIGPVWSVLGNWEVNAPVHIRDMFDRLGIHLLDMDSEVLVVNGRQIGMTGLESPYFFHRTRFLDPGLELDLRLLMLHAPNQLERYPHIVQHFDVVLAAHTHGGQWYIPGFTQWLLRVTGGGEYRFFRGAYSWEGARIFVTRGIGQWLPGRFNAVPEIAVLDIP